MISDIISRHIKMNRKVCISREEITDALEEKEKFLLCNGYYRSKNEGKDISFEYRDMFADRCSLFWQSVRTFAASEDGKQHQRWKRRQRGRRQLRSISILVAANRGGLRRKTSFAPRSGLRAYGTMASSDRFSLVRGGSRDAAVWSTMRRECEIWQGKGFVDLSSIPPASFKTVQPVDAESPPESFKLTCV